ncbi:hypothetical protein KR044_012908, partial [Drosophila immigrans]
QLTDEVTTTPSSVVLVEQPKLTENQKLTASTVKAELELISQVDLTTEATTKTTSSSSSAVTTTTETTTTARTRTASTGDLGSTPRDEGHARSMQFASSTEIISFVAPVTPMKLRPISTATHTTTHMPQLLAALLHAGVTVTPSTSDENAIEEEGQQLHAQPEKRAKFIADNSTNAQQLTMPNGAEVWSLAAMKMVPTTTTTSTTEWAATSSGHGAELTNDIEERNQTVQHKEKNLLDWRQIMIMQASQENHTEPIMMSTTLDATEAATQPTTLKLDIKLNEGEVFTVIVNKTEATTGDRHKDLTFFTAEPSTTETLTPVTQMNDLPTTATTSVTAKAELTELSKLNLTAGEGPVATLARPDTATTDPTITETATATTASVRLPTAERETATTTTTTATKALSSAERETPSTTTTTAMPSALNATPIPNTNTNANEMAMNATEHGNNENGDKAYDVDVESGSKSETDSGDVIDISVSVSTTETTLAATERETTTVSTRTAVEASTVTTPTITTVTPMPTSTSTAQTLHAKVDEQLAASTTTLEKPTATPTEIVQISNEVNLEAITIKQVTNNNNFLIKTTTNSTETPIIRAVNSKPLQIDNNSTTSVTPTSLLTDEQASQKLSEHETSLETNNIGETAGIIVVTTTTVGPVPSTRTVTEAEATAAAANTLDESIAAATTIASAEKGKSELYEDGDDEQQQTKTTAATTTAATTTAATTTAATTIGTTAKTTTTTEEPIISLLDDTTTTTTTSTSRPSPTTTAEPIYSSTHTTNNNNKTNNTNTMLPVESTTHSSDIPTTMLVPLRPTDLDQMHQPPPTNNSGTDVNVIIAITVSVIGVVALILLVAFLYLMRKRQKQMSYGQRCRPVSLDAYSMDNVSVLGSVRRKGRDLRASKRTYGNAAFDDPSLRHNMLSATELGKFLDRKSSIFEEFRDVPQIIARADEVPSGCEDKNRYANVIPLPETRVVLQRQGDDDKTEYINANYVRGPRDAPNYYIACQAPLESTIGDFWRMIWEQQSRVIVQATDLNENGIERCAEYLPPSVTLDNHSSYGDYQVTLKHREVKDKYAISTLMLKRVDGDECRELTHYWYKWPEAGVPLEEAPIIAMLLEARSSLKSYALEQAIELKEKSSTLMLKSMDTALNASAEVEPKKLEESGSPSGGASNEINGNVANKQPRNQLGPLTIHCSPGTGRTGTIIACDMAIRSLETPKRSVDIPQLVYYVRRGRASSVQTKEQYEFIYKVANMYATKITNFSNDN